MQEISRVAMDRNSRPVVDALSPRHYDSVSDVNSGTAKETRHDTPILCSGFCGVVAYESGSTSGLELLNHFDIFMCSIFIPLWVQYERCKLGYAYDRWLTLQ